MKSLAAIALCLGACAMEESSENAGIEIVPVVLSPQLDPAGSPIPGTLLIDTSEGRMDLTSLVPEQPREFASWDEVHRWAEENLNAVTTDEDGKPFAQLSVGFGPTVRYDAELADMVPVDDPITAMLGGRSGTIIVAGESICVDPRGACAALSPRPFISNRERKTSNGLTVDGATGIYRSPGLIEVKTSTSIVSSTKIRTVSCGFLRWCTVYDAPVSLSAYVNAYRSTPIITPGNQIGTGNRYVPAMNTTAVAAALVGIGFDLGPIGGTTGACGISHANDTSGNVAMLLVDGDSPQYGQCQL